VGAGAANLVPRVNLEFVSVNPNGRCTSAMAATRHMEIPCVGCSSSAG